MRTPCLKKYLELNEKFLAEERKWTKESITTKLGQLEATRVDLRQRKAKGEALDDRIKRYEKMISDLRELEKMLNQRP